jgi:hypothetical protein
MTGRRRTTGYFSMPPWATLGLLGILLLGVLAMHGLASHHLAGVGHSEIGATTSTPDMSSPTGRSQADTCKSTVCHKGDHDAPTGLMTVCMAVLVGIAILLIVALRATRHSALPGRTHIRLPVKPTLLGGPDPPNLHELSLLRC